MNILFLGCLFNESDERYLMQKSKIGLSGASNTHQWAIIKGLESINNKPVNIINALPVGTYPKYFKDIVLKARRWSHLAGANNLEIGSVNLPFIKQITRIIKCKAAITKWIMNGCDDEKNIIIYSTYMPYLLAVQHIPKNVPVTLIVTDMPEYYDLNVSVHWSKKVLRAINNRLIYASLKRVNYFVILTEQMKTPLNIGSRPYIVLEGLVSVDNFKMDYNENREGNKKIILYTGTLHLKFGILHLLSGFQLINKENYELWICGSGEAENEIRKYSRIDGRIKFFGYISKEEIYNMQLKATILINPRSNDGEYTKYSFPSKTMEYLLSGRPVLMYKLDGIPDEYDQYVYYIDSSQPKDIACRIIEVCEKPQSELDNFGEKARQFVLENKNCSIQAKKIFDMMKKNQNQNYL